MKKMSEDEISALFAAKGMTDEKKYSVWTKEKVAEAPEVEEKDEYEVVGVRFKSTGKVYYFDPRGLTMQEGECAIVETARGLEYGFVSMANKVVPRSHVFLPLRPVIRRATDADRQRYEENQVKEVEAGKICCRKVEEHNLKMKIVDVEYTFDNSKLLFYFTFIQIGD